MPKPFNCSMCSAPLDLSAAVGMTVRCHYCGNTVILPEELRTVSSGSSKPSPGHSILSMVDRALKMAEISQLLHAGNKIAAIKLYRETFGVGLKEAKEAMEQMERGQAVTFAQSDIQPGGTLPHAFQPTDSISHVVNLRGKRIGRWIVGIVVLLVLVPIILAAFGIFSAFNAVNRSISTMPGSNPGSTTSGAPTPTPSFAGSVFEFGSEGIGAGQFKDARSIAIDGEGRLYVGEYSSGRVQVFDGNGKFITQWMVDPKKALLNLAVDRKGIVYVVHPNMILRYDGATGNLLGEVAKPESNRNEFYSDVFVALDGTLYAIGSNSNILHLTPEGGLKSLIKVAEKVGDSVSFDKVAVDGSGNIFALEDHQQSIFKFTADGKYINRFGGKGKEAGQLSSPRNIAVDGQGRVYVSDVGRGIQVFDGNGRYIDSFGAREVIFGIAINDRNEIFATERNRFKIVKYVLSK